MGEGVQHGHLLVVGPTERGSDWDPAALDPYRSLARFLFAILAIVALTGFALVPIRVGGLDPARILAVWPLVAILVADVVATVVVLLALVRGLTRRSAWAIHAIQPVCVVLIVIGAMRAIIALTQGQLPFPLEAIGGALVLMRRPDPDLLPPAAADDRRRVTIAAGVLFASYFVPLVLPLALA